MIRDAGVGVCPRLVPKKGTKLG